MGRVRASAPVAGTLQAGAVARCSHELHRLLLERFSDDPLVVPHRVWAVTARTPT